jgi:hypothetical protein
VLAVCSWADQLQEMCTAFFADPAGCLRRKAFLKGLLHEGEFVVEPIDAQRAPERLEGENLGLLAGSLGNALLIWSIWHHNL